MVYLQVHVGPLCIMFFSKDKIIRNGPAAYYSLFWVERYIVNLVLRLNARRDPVKSLFRACLLMKLQKLSMMFHSDLIPKTMTRLNHMVDGR